MGWERKRGKLEELNRLLRGADRHHLPAGAGGSRRRPQGVRYVLTLDADTRLPREAARRLIGTMAHPLNRPRFDAAPRPRRRGLRHAPAAGHPDAADRRATARSSSASSRGRPASTPTPPPSPTSTRTSSARARSPARGSTTSTPSRRRSPARVPENRAAQPRPLRGDLRPRRPGHRHRAVRGVPRPLRGRRRPPAPLGARRLAAAAVDPRPRAAAPASGGRQRGLHPVIGRWKMIDNLRRTLLAPAALLTLLAGWTLPRRHAGALDALRAGDDRAAGRSCACSAACCRAGRGIAKRSHFLALRRRRPPRRRAGGAARSSSSPTRPG